MRVAVYRLEEFTVENTWVYEEDDGEHNDYGEDVSVQDDFDKV